MQLQYLQRFLKLDYKRSLASGIGYATEEQHRWAHVAVMSRAFGSPRAFPAERDEFDEGWEEDGGREDVALDRSLFNGKNNALMPFADLLDHAVDDNVVYVVRMHHSTVSSIGPTTGIRVQYHVYLVRFADLLDHAVDDNVVYVVRMRHSTLPIPFIGLTTDVRAQCSVYLTPPLGNSSPLNTVLFVTLNPEQKKLIAPLL